MFDRGGKAYIRQEGVKTEKERIALEIITASNSTKKRSLEEILLVRILLESYTVREACKNLTEDDLKELEYLTLNSNIKCVMEEPEVRLTCSIT